MLSTNELSYEQEVCNILKKTAINQRLEELKEGTKATGQEHAFNVCSDGSVTKLIKGTNNSIDMSEVNNECNHQIDLGIHSHPQSIAYPSSDDFVEELQRQPKIADCVYGEEDDKITCYMTSDELRNKYKPLLDDTINKVNEIITKYNNTNNIKEKIKLIGEHIDVMKRYIHLTTEIKNNIIKDIYPNINSYVDYANYILNSNPKFGNFGDVWVKDCGKI